MLIDTKLLSQDPEGQALLAQQKLLLKEKRQFVDQQRKLHEGFIREQKEFTQMLNKVKAGQKQGQAPSAIEELIKEC